MALSDLSKKLAFILEISILQEYVKEHFVDMQCRRYILKHFRAVAFLWAVYGKMYFWAA